MKGILHIGPERKFVFQGVHMLFSGEPRRRGGLMRCGGRVYRPIKFEGLGRAGDRALAPLFALSVSPLA